jgi:hypothetical protein
VRPVYETSADRRAQAEAIGWLAAATGSTPVEMPALAPWDYEMVRDGLAVAIVEVKVRRCTMREYPTYMVSEAKARGLRDAAIERGIAGVLLVRWSDAAGWLRLDAGQTVKWTVGLGGRVDRGDPADIERVVLLPIAWFGLLAVPRVGQ